MAGTYKTSGRERLLRFLSAHPDTPYTVDELAAALHQNEDSQDKPSSRMGKSSLYRQLSELVSEGTVRRDRASHDAVSDSRTAAAVYRYIGRSDCSSHFHLQCVICGRLLHLDCALVSDLLSHIQAHHRFTVHMGRSILYGICDECKENGGNEEHGATLKKLF